VSTSDPTQTRSPLAYRVFTATRPGINPDLPPGYEPLAWVANSATLIYGERDAVLVDTFFTLDHSARLVDEVAATGKNLTYIYITHAHGDHFFGINTLKARFPNARAVAPASVVARIHKRLIGDTQLLSVRFPGQIPENPQVPEGLDGSSIELEGRPLIPIQTGFTDSADSTSLHVPSIGLVVAGDVVYRGIHPFLAETNPESRSRSGATTTGFAPGDRLERASCISAEETASRRKRKRVAELLSPADRRRLTQTGRSRCGRSSSLVAQPARSS
jgi:glyoxylase-like metal-dependent hydrolase (beta-lactamase superfamily II)